LKLIDNIKQSIGSYFFRREMMNLKRNRYVMNLSDAKTIGIIYDASEEDKYSVVSNFVRYFQDNQKTVKALGFVNYNRLPHYCFPKLSYDYFTKRDLNWYSKPTESRVKDFMNEEFDIVIDLCMHDCFPLSYIAGLSKAKFKVGRYDEKHSVIYDFMLNVNNNITLESYIKEVIHYLSIINKNQDAQ
jgi:hypothetical protein